MERNGRRRRRRRPRDPFRSNRKRDLEKMALAQTIADTLGRPSDWGEIYLDLKNGGRIRDPSFAHHVTREMRRQDLRQLGRDRVDPDQLFFGVL